MSKELNAKMNNRNDWICEFCSFKNSKASKICSMCYNESLKVRYEKFMNVVKENNVKNKQKVSVGSNKIKNAENDNKPKWSCKVCTFVNTGDGDMCAMCNEIDKER